MLKICPTCFLFSAFALLKSMMQVMIQVAQVMMTYLYRRYNDQSSVLPIGIVSHQFGASPKVGLLSTILRPEVAAALLRFWAYRAIMRDARPPALPRLIALRPFGVFYALYKNLIIIRKNNMNIQKKNV